MMTESPNKDLLAPYAKYLKWMVVLAALLVYSNTLNHEMALDDYSVIVTHSYVQNGIEGIPAILKTNYRNGNSGFNDGLYRPLSLVMFAIEKEYFNSSSRLAHFINILLYGLSCMVLYLSLKKILDNYPLIVPFAASLIFVVHPLHTEVVANIKGRDDLLALFGLVLCLFYLLKLRESKKTAHLIIALLFFILALLSKESSVVFALMIPLLLLLNSDYHIKDALRTTLLLLPFSIAFMLLRYSIVNGMDNPIDPGNFGLLNNPLADTKDISLRWGSAFALQLLFLKKFFLAAPLIHDYSYDLIKLSRLNSLQAILGIVVFIALIASALYGIIKKNTLGLLAGIYLLSIAVASQLLMPIGTIFAERLLFISVLPFALLVPLLLNHIQTSKLKKRIKQQQYSAVFLLLVMLIYTPMTFSRNKDWKNNTTLYTADLEKGSQSARINYNFGSQMLDIADLSPSPLEKSKVLNAGIKHLSMAISIYPEYYDAYNNLSLCYRKTKDFKSAEKVVLKNIQLKPDYTKNYLNLGQIYFETKSYRKAIEYLKQYVQLKPSSFDTYFLMGQAAGNLNQFEEAIGYLNQAISIDPNYIEAYNFLGMAYGFTNQSVQAAAVLNKALQIQPGNVEIMFNLSIAYHGLGETTKEINLLQNILKIQPQHPGALQNLGQLRNSQ